MGCFIAGVRIAHQTAHVCTIPIFSGKWYGLDKVNVCWRARWDWELFFYHQTNRSTNKIVNESSQWLHSKEHLYPFMLSNKADKSVWQFQPCSLLSDTLISFSTSYHFSNSNEALMVAAASLQQTSSNIFKSLETNKFIRILAYLLMLRNVVAFATPKTYSHIMLIKNCFGTLNLKSFGSSTQMKKTNSFMHFNASLSSKIWQEASWFPEKSHGKNASPSEQKVPLSRICMMLTLLNNK